MTRSEKFPNIPIKKKIIRIETYLSQTVICSDGAKGLKCKLIFSRNEISQISSFFFRSCLSLL
jgi:hypothetical protein